MVLNDTQIKHSQTRNSHHALNINTNIFHLLEHNILSPSYTQSGASLTPICWTIEERKGYLLTASMFKSIVNFDVDGFDKRGTDGMNFYFP